MQLAPIRETGPGLLNSGSEFGEAWLLPPAREHRVPTRSWSIPALFARGGRCTLRGARKSLRPAWAACKPVVGIEVAVECVKAGSEPCFSVAYAEQDQRREFDQVAAAQLAPWQGTDIVAAVGNRGCRERPQCRQAKRRSVYQVPRSSAGGRAGCAGRGRLGICVYVGAPGVVETVRSVDSRS